MPSTNLPHIVRPAELQYDQWELLAGGAQFARLDTLDELRRAWAEMRGTKPYACCGTGAYNPAMFLRPHEWIFAPTKTSLISAITRWDEFGIFPSWYDSISLEQDAHDGIDASRFARRNLLIRQGRWGIADEAAFRVRTSKSDELILRGFWMLTKLPCGLSHYDWFSEQAAIPDDANLDRAAVDSAMRIITYDDWKKYCPVDDVMIFEGEEVAGEIEYWELELAAGRDPYED